ncbi:MAG: MFS transporter [bacterium]|nr:MFS transporter [bacterium]
MKRRLGIRIPNTFRSLKYYNFRLYFIGQSISLIGTWMQRVTVPWVVYRLTGSSLLLGVTGFASQLPTFILAPFAGTIVDRVNRYKLLFVTQTIAMAQALALYFFYVTGHVNVQLIIFLNTILGTVNAFDMPARQSLFIHLVEGKEDLNNAIALNSSMVNLARLIGPSIAGIIITTRGEAACFLINAISYLFVIGSLAMMRLNLPEPAKLPHQILKDLKEGVAYIKSHSVIFHVITLLAIVSLIGMPYTILLPVYSKEVLKGGAHTYGFLMGSIGIGALVGALAMASRKNIKGIGKTLPYACFIFGSALLFLSLVNNFYVAAVLIAIAGFGMVSETITSNTLLQLTTEEKKRGRVMSFYTFSFTGMAPFGSLLAGWLSQNLGVRKAFLISGLVLIVGGLHFHSKMKSFKEKEYF